MKMGEHFEKSYSTNISKNEYPFLISELLLREKNLGQIDFAKCFKHKKKFKIQIFEIKTKSAPNKFQFIRLKRTQDYLSQILETEVELKISLCQKTNDSLFY
jgi:hypothetical protein